MPRLRRLRFVSIGHPLARMSDLTLDFRDAQGRATDSTIWLRNGGGKSSLLNLFFAIPRPHKAAFLGGKADSKQRALDDYILQGDRAVTVAEWELDAPSDSPAGEDHFLTGVFYERREGSGELRRQFFATRSSGKVPESMLEGLPLYTTAAGRRSRRTLAAFREEWLALRDRAPQLEPVVTDNQGEWRSILEAARIDPDLFAYQVQMNLREGGADELFRFAEPEDFIDFLLELALDPALGDRVGKNLLTYRRELVDRREKLVPERDLVVGLVQQFGPLSAVCAERETLRGELSRARSSLAGLGRAASGRLAALAAELESTEELVQAHLASADRHAQAAGLLRTRAALVARHAAEVRLNRLKEEHRQVEGEWREADRRKKLWTAAVPLRQALQMERRAAQIREQIAERQAEHAPLRSGLVEAASLLDAALAARGSELRRLAAEALEQEGQARGEAQECRRKAAEAKAQEAAALATADHLRLRMEEIEAERGRLVKAGVLLAEESAAEGAARCLQAAEEGERAAARLEADLARTEEKLEALAEPREAARKLLADRQAEARELEARWKEAEAERAALEADPTLRAALEIEEPDLDRLGEDALHAIDGRARQEEERIVELRLAAAAGERAALSIAESGLLPPSEEVQALVKVLRQKLGAAWSGWSWIAGKAKKGAASELVRRAPYLAQGVVVRPADLERARQVLAESGMEPAGPVVIAGTEAFDLAPALPGEVVGPAEAAWFDKEAARRRLAALEIELEEHRRAVGEAERAHRSLTACREALRAFRGRHPLGWFAASRAARERMAGALEEARAGLETLEAARREQEELCQRLKGQLKEAQAFLVEARSLYELTARFAEQAARGDAWREELEAAGRQAAQAAQEAEALLQAAGAADHRAESARAEAGRHGEDARVYEEERKSVSYLEEPAPPRPGPLDELRDRHRQLVADYEEKIGAEGLLALSVDREASARQERERFERLRPREVREEDVRAALEELPEPDRVEEVRQEAEEKTASLVGLLGNLKQRRDTAQETLSRAQEGCRGLGPLELDQVPASPEEAEAEAGRAAQGAAQEEAGAAGDKAAADQAAGAVEGIRSLRRELEAAEGRLKGIQENFEDLLGFAGEPVEAADGRRPEDTAFTEVVTGIEKGLRKARARWQDLDRRRQEAAGALRKLMTSPQFERLDTPWTHRLQEQGAAELEERSRHLMEQLQLRRQHLEAQIAEVERHRSILVEEVSSVAEEGLKLLRGASSLSRLPDHLPGLGGAQFLRISAQVPDDPAERRARLAELVDDLVTKSDKIGGVDLVRGAVRRLARPVQVRVLHPDPALNQRTVSIPEMARFSGGEQLTGAILLYCTLARIRARERGMSQHPSGVLILDNPIGRVSRIQFLDLQREVARAMGVQLIYATGVNDHEALRTLPNLIRLRNERIDRNSGHRLVEIPEGPGGVEGVRVGRREAKPEEAPPVPAPAP